MNVKRFNCQGSPKRLFLFITVFVCFLCVSVLYIQEWSPMELSDFLLGDRFSRADRNKPHLVIGILSTNSSPRDGMNSSRRDAIRSTWLATMKEVKHKLPFRITYKFLVDEPNDAIRYENKLYNDIVYINVTNHGWANKFGEKLHFWLKYIVNNFPDVSLGVKMDDDVYLCFPSIIYKLFEVKSPTLYYGWKHGEFKSQNITPPFQHIDEMFVVLGRDLIKRIANRKYCGKKTCESKYELQEDNYGDTSLALWLSLYKDVDLHADNLRILQMWSSYTKYFVSNYVCENYRVFHKCLPDKMYDVHRLNPYKGYLLDNIISANTSSEHTRDYIDESAATGSLFTGYIERYKIPPVPRSIAKHVGTLPGVHSNITCDNWAVVTTIQRATKAVKNLLKDINWCIVVVADLKTPSKSEYLKSLTAGLDGKRLTFLSVKEQSSLFPLLSESIPYNSIGRKNIGFMYAIYRRAKAIWDFDDDNIGIINLKEFGPEAPANSYVKVCNGSETGLINPYSYFGVQESLTWPRGFPLQSIKEQKTRPKVCPNTEPIKVGVIQSLANGQPDVDAIYRFTRTVPFNFKTSKNHRGYIIPKDYFSPFNAQATLWLSPAFEFMPLPISVNGRVSDIWRSYIAQYFMHQKDIKLTFVRPYVIQERNEHTIIRDFNAEKDLYEKGKQITDFLSRPKVNFRRFETMTELYENLYKRKYIEFSDLRLIKAWETTFSNVTGKKANDSL